MNESQIEQIRRFINNPEMSGVVKSQLLSTFAKKQANRDVYLLAAQTLSKELLEEAWDSMSRTAKDSPEPKEPKQVGI